MQLIVGLGNPGEKYKNNRHNSGFIVLDNAVARAGLSWDDSSLHKGFVAKGAGVVYLKPQTYMNLSGESVSSLSNYYKIVPENITIVHDDVDLPFGTVKSQIGGSSAGHHGIEDIIEKLGTKEFKRVRIGVGRPEDRRFEVDAWVLSDFTAEELEFVNGIEV
jgi:peptidyl-tRNA hydrolase, PTH1 family